MEFLFWLWIVLAAFFIIAEIFTMGFFLLWFGIGAAVAALLSYLDIGVAWQLVVFIVIGIAGYLLSRPLAQRMSRGVELRVGAERFVGKTARVLETVEPLSATGRVRVEQEEWKAEPEGNETISEGETVEVVRVDGNHLVVRPATDDQG
jgi:membrane protein implicated in regulation of membrane protease activity